MATKTKLIGSCQLHGEFYKDAPDSPCPTCEDLPVEDKRRPRLGCAGIVSLGCNGVLLGVRNKEPARGTLVLPGGGVKWGESLEDTLQREIDEETGMAIQDIRFFRPYEIIRPPDEHRIILYFYATACAGHLQGGDDLLDPNFYTSAEINEAIKTGKIEPFIAGVLRDAGVIL